MSARLRLTLSYAGFLLVAGVALIALLFYILRFVPEGNLPSDGPFLPDRSDLLDALWPRVWQVLAALTVIGLVGGWFLAGRMLRPLVRINDVARGVAAGSLDRRVNLEGPHDEFWELANTLDSMLERLQHSFDEQRRFAANASHELRTPHAITQSILDVAAADPAGQDMAQLVRRLDETNRRGIEVVEAVIALAALDSPAELEREPVDIAELTADVLDQLRPLALNARVEVRSQLGEGDLDGRTVLVRQLVTNLVTNAIRYNRADGGTVEVTTATTPAGAVELTVANTGPMVPPELVATMTEPFVRGAGRVAYEGAERAGGRGAGLGLAIVARIAQVHRAELHLDAVPDGGLIALVRFPAPGSMR